MDAFRTILYFPCLVNSIAGRKIRENLSKHAKRKSVIIRNVCYTKNNTFFQNVAFKTS